MTDEEIIEMAKRAGLHVATEHRVQARHGSTQMTEREIQMDILRVCKVAGHDGDFNVVGFYALCDRLKQLGAEEERKACKAKIVAFAKLVAAKEREACAKLFEDRDNGIGYYEPHEPAEIIRARGQA